MDETARHYILETGIGARYQHKRTFTHMEQASRAFEAAGWIIPPSDGKAGIPIPKFRKRLKPSTGGWVARVIF